MQHAVNIVLNRNWHHICVHIHIYKSGQNMTNVVILQGFQQMLTRKKEGINHTNFGFS
jgi:hypothetical protein